MMRMFGSAMIPGLDSILHDLTLAKLMLAAAILFLAYFIRGITGFGSALVAVPLLLFILPLKTVVPMIVALDFFAAASQGIRKRSAICWGDILPLLPFSLLGVFSAIYLLKNLDASLLLTTLGSFIVIYAIYSLLPISIRQQHSRLWAIPAGSLGGLIGALFGTGGPFYVIYLKLRGLDKTAFRATIAMIFLIDGGMRLSGFALTGLYNPKLITLMALSLPIMSLALYIGGHIHTNISQLTFQRLISITLIFSGAGLILK